MCVFIKQSKTVPLTPVDFEYRVEVDESQAVVLIRPVLADGGRTNAVERVEVVRVLAVFRISESAVAVPLDGRARRAVADFVGQLINHDPDRMCEINRVHRQLMADRVAIPTADDLAPELEKPW